MKNKKDWDLIRIFESVNKTNVKGILNEDSGMTPVGDDSGEPMNTAEKPTAPVKSDIEKTQIRQQATAEARDTNIYQLFDLIKSPNGAADIGLYPEITKTNNHILNIHPDIVVDEYNKISKLHKLALTKESEMGTPFSVIRFAKPNNMFQQNPLPSRNEFIMDFSQALINAYMRLQNAL